MDLLLVVVCAFGASWLTFFSGFGLGTILTPVFYFVLNDLTLAIAATAIVHFLNNIFKFILMQKKVDWKIALPFGLATIPAAFFGAYLLSKFDDSILFTYQIGDSVFNIQLMNLIFGILLILFALVEMVPKLSLNFSRNTLWLGGLVSGFFGGLSGHQGALRTAFLSKYKLDKEVFVATGIVIALTVDVVRTGVYFSSFDLMTLKINWLIILLPLLAALIGAITGKYFLKKMNWNMMTVVIGISMFVFGIALAAGFLSK